MTPNENEWEWFKRKVKELRKYNEQLIRENNGSNDVMTSISLIARDIGDWIEINPHAIDLRTGKVFVKWDTNEVVGWNYKHINTKRLLALKRICDSLWEKEE